MTLLRPLALDTKSSDRTRHGFPSVLVLLGEAIYGIEPSCFNGIGFSMVEGVVAIQGSGAYISDTAPHYHSNEGLIALSAIQDSELAATSPRSKRVFQADRFSESLCLGDIMTRDGVATIPNIDALSPNTKRKHDVNAAEDREALLETETSAKRLKPAGPCKVAEQ
ncbi:hypothetical protein CPB85DRAFT_1258128 [Mucidula mucida]|nr:hypothetical protein CPB85DRAFT_1258128 [Mucidula mucida]